MGPTEGTWEDLIVLRAATSWDGTRFPEQHLAEHLRHHAPVLYVDPPLSRRHARQDPRLADALHEPRLRVIEEGLARVTPRMEPGRNKPGLLQLADVVTAIAVRRSLRDLGRPRVRALLSVRPRPFFSLTGHELKAFWAQDDYTQGTELVGRSRWRARREQRTMMTTADLVIAASEVIAGTWSEAGCRVALVPNGCDPAAYRLDGMAPRPADVELRPPIVGFVGSLSDRIDLTFLDRIAEEGHSLLLVGQRQHTFDIDRIQPLLRRENVQWVGPKPFAELPAYLAAIDVGVVPYADSGFNRASFPLKLLEYLAAGLPVVTTDLPAARWLATDLILVADSTGDFADAVRRAIPTRHDPRLVRLRSEFADEHSWERRASDVARELGVIPAKAGAR